MRDFDAAVLEFIQESGFTATYVKQTQGEYDPATGTVGTTVVEIPVQVILMDLTLQSNGLSTKYGTLVEAGDKELFMRPPHKTDPAQPILDIHPASDTVKVGTTVYKIVTMKELNPTTSDPILYMLYLRR